MLKKRGFLLLIVFTCAVIFLLPIKVRCGAPGKSCATAPDEQGVVSYVYAYEPVGVYALELIFDTDITLHYATGRE